MLEVGIIGLPNVGKSTLFTALTKKQVPCENFPFCTIDPNVGIVAVPDERIKKLAEIEGSLKSVPTAIKFVDIAGLVAGAHKGEGLGNQFLAAIREVDVICHVVRAFEDANVHHVEGSVNPDRDRETILTELILADVATCERALEKAKSDAKSGEKEAARRLDVIERLSKHLGREKSASDFERAEEEKLIIKDLHLLTDKPIVEAVNTNLEVKSQNSQSLAMDFKLEAELASLSEEELEEYLKELDLEEPALDRLIRVCYRTLDLITFFTVGEKETHTWTIKKGAKAPEAGGRVHSDFEKNFIKAEVIHYDDFISCGGWKGVKGQGKIRLEGKEYIVQEGDVINIHHL